MQIATLLANFSPGAERVQAAAVLFTRTCDSEDHLADLLGGLAKRDQESFRSKLGCYADLMFTSPNGKDRAKGLQALAASTQTSH